MMMWFLHLVVKSNILTMLKGLGTFLFILAPNVVPIYQLASVSLLKLVYLLKNYNCATLFV